MGCTVGKHAQFQRVIRRWLEIWMDRACFGKMFSQRRWQSASIGGRVNFSGYLEPKGTR